MDEPTTPEVSANDAPPQFDEAAHIANFIVTCYNELLKIIFPSHSPEDTLAVARFMELLMKAGNDKVVNEFVSMNIIYSLSRMCTSFDQMLKIKEALHKFSKLIVTELDANTDSIMKSKYPISNIITLFNTQLTEETKNGQQGSSQEGNQETEKGQTA